MTFDIRSDFHRISKALFIIKIFVTIAKNALFIIFSNLLIHMRFNMKETHVVILIRTYLFSQSWHIHNLLITIHKLLINEVS